MKQIIDYATPRAEKKLSSSAAVSLALGLAALGMNALFWDGDFASETAWIPLSAALIAAVLPVAGIITGSIGGAGHWAAVTGISCSIASLAVSLGLLGYFLTHLPVC